MNEDGDFPANEEDQFLSSVRADPYDDGPRLVYADWLEERGDSRAEFIRMQCELARSSVRNARRNALVARCDVLLAAGLKKWLGPIEPWLISYEFERGFLRWAHVRAGVFPEHAPDLYRVGFLAELSVDLRGVAPGPALRAISADVAREYQVLPLALWGGQLALAVQGRQDWDVIRAVESTGPFTVWPLQAGLPHILDAIARLYGRVELHQLTGLTDEGRDRGKEERLCQQIVREAKRQGADEIRIDLQQPESARLRYRVDGRWIQRGDPPFLSMAGLAARLVELAGIDLRHPFRAPKGDAQLPLDDGSVDLRVSVRTDVRGQTVMIRL